MANASPLSGNAGLPRVFLGIARDITEGKEAEKVMREQHQFRQLLLGVSSEFLAVDYG